MAIAAPAVAPAVTVVAPDAAAARRVPISGPPRRVADARAVLARFGDQRVARRIAFRRDRDGRQVLVVDAPRRLVGGPAARLAEWRAQVLAAAIARRLARRGARLDLTRILARGRSFSGSALPPPAVARDAPGPRALAADVGARAAAAGLVVHGTVVPLAPAALRLDVTLREADLLATPRGWTTAPLHPLEHREARVRYDLLELVRDPSGRPIGERGAPVPVAPPPAALLAGPTRLVVTFTVPGTRPRSVEHVLDCAGSASQAVPDPARSCDRVLRDRWALLGIPSDACAGIDGTLVAIRGVVAGRRVERDHGRCYGPVQRWADALGVDVPTTTG